MRGDRLEVTDAAIEALRSGRAPDGPPLRGQEDTDTNAVRVATLLALGAGRGPRPDPAFVARLESDLLARQTAWATGSAARRRPTLFSGWPRLGRRFGAALALPAVLAVALLIVRGPRQALADVQRLLGYVPGLGFVATQDVRVLVEPVAITREGATVGVEQVIAGARDTRIVLSVDTTVAARNGEDQLTRVPEAGVTLRTLAGEEIALTAWSQSTEGAVLTFGPLPVEADTAVLAMRVPPGLPARAEASEEWVFHLSLRREDVTSNSARLIATYDPGLPEREHHGIALRVLDVAHTADETVVRVGIVDYPALEASPPPHLSGRLRPTLRDDAGRSYAARRSPGVGFEGGMVAAQAGGASAEEPARHEVLAFEPLHPEARELTLTVDGVYLNVPASGALQVDLGDAPQIGDVFPVDAELEIAGATVHLTGARLVHEELEMRDGIMERTLLRFDARQVTPQDPVIVTHVGLVGDRSIVSGSSSSGGQDGIYAVGVEFRDGRIPTGLLTLSLEEAAVVYTGPWELTWSVPPTAGAQ